MKNKDLGLFCDVCGTEFEDYMLYCPVCGAEKQHYSIKYNKLKETEHLVKVWRNIAVGCMLCIIFLCVYVLIAFKL